MKTNFLERLKSEILVADGAIGTTLKKLGQPLDESTEAWGIINKDLLQSVHREYLLAGADILLTNTFGGNRFRLQKYNLSHKVYEINRCAAEIAIEVAGEKAYVAGDIGACGELMEPYGTVTEAEVYKTFAEQAAALKAGGVDLIIIETMMDISEAQAAIKAAKDATALPVIACMSFNPDKNGFRTMMGVSPKQAALGMVEAGADVIGSNCGSVLMAQMPDLIKEFRSIVDNYICVEPNAGIPQLIDGKAVFPQSPEEMASFVDAVRSAGANIIGGCCGTTPEHIRLIAQKVKGSKM